ncbi:uncharacterized protein F4812DRAFT_290982 [Daldinia caldariorum]|uniref:uncharacterized protein n=1 Tax=Daldinia caldariorum TaxID=326644 RepID=UPI002007CDEF|nr:uncharacterized protein F4812DRAFT_290982 [Daldinia caldariorum]KAI1462964.1 hypothetical protein F4812DRAFT_290982 [Daldinia caldariorum]
MAPGHQRKLSLPATLLKELDAQQPSSSVQGGGRSRRQLSRREQRKAQRVQKKLSRRPQPRQNQEARKPHKSSQANGFNGDDDESDALEDDGEDGEEGDADDLDMEDSSEGSDGESDGDEEPSQPKPSKATKSKLAQDDAEIKELEKKLGLRGRKSLPKSFQDDGLGDLLDGLDEDDGGNIGPASQSRRKTEADEWLAQKRKKAQAAAEKAAANESAGDSDEDGDDLDDENMLSGDGNSEKDDEDAFEGFSDQEKPALARPPRENPYVAPTTGVAKYVPPAFRKQSGSGDEAEARIRRRVQGLMNRLTTDSMFGLVKDFMALYDTNPRQTVTSAIVDLILALVCSPEKRPDSFFTMVAGFLAAMHKSQGMAFSAYCIQRLVEIFDQRYRGTTGDKSDPGLRHLISLLAEIYNMQIVGPGLVFDYIRLLLHHHSELNTELLLRIIQLCGPSLRRDDPHVLGDIVSMARPDNTMSTRTIFMIDEMKRLHSNKSKAANRNKDLAEQRVQIRRRIGGLGGTHDAQPLRMGLQEIRDADKHGKWWLVGASWSGSHSNTDGQGDTPGDEEGDDADEMMVDVGDDLGIPDLWQLAKQQGFNTEVRQRIFVALHAATDYENAELLVRKLGLNKHQRKEIPEVIVRSSERQSQYNPYYALVATRFTGDRELAFQFRRCLTTRLRKMGEDIEFGDDDDPDIEDWAEYDMRWIYNAAKTYGSLVASRALRLADIVKHRNFGALQANAHLFFEVMFISILQECGRSSLKEVFSGLDAKHARGVLWFLRMKVCTTDLLKDTKEKVAIKKSYNAVEELLSVLASSFALGGLSTLR